MKKLAFIFSLTEEMSKLQNKLDKKLPQTKQQTLPSKQTKKPKQKKNPKPIPHNLKTNTSHSYQNNTDFGSWFDSNSMKVLFEIRAL